MKATFTIVGCLVAAVASYYSFALRQENGLLNQQIVEHYRLRQQLLGQIEENTRQRLQYQQQIETLQENLLSSTSQLNHLSSQRQTPKEMTSPDYDRLESDIRNVLEIEYAEEIERWRKPAAVASLISSLSSLDGQERRAVIQVERQFRSVLEGLDIDESRREALVQLLVQFTSDRILVRQDIISSNLPRDEIRRQLQGVNNPDFLATTLSAVLNPDEILQFQELQ